MVNKKQQVVLKLGPMVSSVAGCPLVDLFSTEYTNLFLTRGDNSKFEVMTEVDLITLVNTKIGYSYFLSEKETIKGLEAASQDLCRTKLDLKQKQELSLGNGTFLT